MSKAKKYLDKIGCFNTIYLKREKDSNTMAKIMEAYTNEVLKNLTIPVVVRQSEQLNVVKTNPNFKEWLKGFEKIGEKHYCWGKGYIMNIEEMEEKHIELIDLNI